MSIGSNTTCMDVCRAWREQGEKDDKRTSGQAEGQIQGLRGTQSAVEGIWFNSLLLKSAFVLRGKELELIFYRQLILACLTQKGVKSELERAVSSTYMNQDQGTCTVVKITRLGHTPAQILDNIKSAIPYISFQLKTSTSVSLPLWNCALDDLEEGWWYVLTAVAGEVNNEEVGAKTMAAVKAVSVSKIELQQACIAVAREKKKENIDKSKG
ncbi:hypothetical protein BDQ17DRAFT_1432065 [Cyathus striatus]|nr:hypothetical protein BDQ17DRAFT_1432065 [Cyathus striatus]